MDHPLTQTWELVQKAKAGDGDALNRLFQRYYERVRRCVRARIGTRLRTRMESDDILQPTFAKAFENFDRFEMRHEGSFLHWLAEYAERQVHDAVDRENAKKRKAPAGQVSLDDDGTDAPLQVAGASIAPIDQVAISEREAVVEQCLDLLPEHYRRVIVLRDYDGLEWSEVADVLGKNTESAAREQHRRAMVEFSKLLRQRGIGPETT
ncbi:MAG TPA: sigma-70 family RNA polymerase sigma factor [Planctomycetota bacterium]|nr:sigma-70 family RNA polymerase sigma factor [Planctomycetota bacterium]